MLALLVFLAAGPAAEATKVIDAGDAAFNAHDAKAMISLLDKSFFSCGARVASCTSDPTEFKKNLEDGFRRSAEMGAQATRTNLLIGADDSGTVVWFIADYLFKIAHPKPGQPAEKVVRESGALVKRGKTWRFVMLHNAWPVAEAATSR